MRRFTEGERVVIATLYICGVSVESIAEHLGALHGGVKSAVRTLGLKRDESKFSTGLKWLAREGEEFRPCAGFPGYWVSNLGRVFSMRIAKPGTERVPEVDEDGYLRVNLVVGHEKTKHIGVNRLAAIAFHGDPPEGAVAAHGNGIRSDNRAVNLRWATQAENIADKIAHGTHQAGEKHGSAKTTESQIKALKAALKEGESLASAAAIASTTVNVAADVSRGRTWRHVQ